MKHNPIVFYEVVNDKLGNDSGPYTLDFLLNYICYEYNVENPDVQIEPMVRDGKLIDSNRLERDPDWLLAERVED